MATKSNPRVARKRRHARLRAKVMGTEARPRLCVFRSLNHIYAQVIDDTKQHTLTSASSLDSSIVAEAKQKTKLAAAESVGSLAARRARERGISRVTFDRGGYKYHGRVKALAEAARREGLIF